MKLKWYERRRLLKLADHLDYVFMSTFNIEYFQKKNECGTVACAVGHACNIPSFRRAGLRLVPSYPGSPFYSVQYKKKYDTTFPIPSFEAVRKFFGKETSFLFLPSTYAENKPLYFPLDKWVTPQMVAKKIRKFVQENDNLYRKS